MSLELNLQAGRTGLKRVGKLVKKQRIKMAYNKSLEGLFGQSDKDYLCLNKKLSDVAQPKNFLKKAVCFNFVSDVIYKCLKKPVYYRFNCCFNNSWSYG